MKKGDFIIELYSGGKVIKKFVNPQKWSRVREFDGGIRVYEDNGERWTWVGAYLIKEKKG